MSLAVFASTFAFASFRIFAFAQEGCRDPYANQTIQWIDCPTDNQPTLQCATLDVPIDYTDLSAGTLNLPVVRVPATDASPKGSVITNPGGPGASGIEDVVQFGKLSQNLTGPDYHIVSFDPRGVGLTTPYKCPTVTTVSGFSLPLTSNEGLNATYIQNVNQGLYCNQSEYRQASTLVGTAFVARDLMSIVNALGEDGMIRYWGSSYGTLLGATIAAMFPDKIDRMLLDGNINPTDYYHGTNEESVDDADAAQTNFFKACASAGPEYCALASDGVTGQDLEQQWLDYVEAYANQSIVYIGPSGAPWGYSSIKSSLFADLKYPGLWNDTAARMYNFLTGSQSTDSLKRDAPFDPLAATTAEGDPYETLTAITCGDWDEVPGNGTLEDFSDYLKLYLGRSPHNGDMLVSILYGCATWKVNSQEKFTGLFENIETKNPILFINGHFDPVTPLISARNSSSGFVGSGVMNTNLAGHCISGERSKCVNDKVKSYFQTGELPDLTELCEPDTPAFLPREGITRNLTNDAPDDEEKYYQKRFEHNPDFEYPAALRDVKRDVYEILLAKRQTTTLPNCTSLAISTISSVLETSINSAVGRHVGTSILLSIIVVAGAVVASL